MGQSGEDVQLSEAARSVFPYAIECKSRAALAVYAFWEQAMTHLQSPKEVPIAVIKQNNSVPLVLVELEHFMDLVKKAHENLTT